MAGSSQVQPLLILCGLVAIVGGIAFWVFKGARAEGLDSMPTAETHQATALSTGETAVDGDREAAELGDPALLSADLAKATEELPPHAFTIRLQGRVTDAHSGEAIPGAKVMISDRIPSRAVFRPESSLATPAPFVLSDGQGYYASSSVLSTARTQAYAWHPDYILREIIVLNRSRAADGSGPAVNFALTPRSAGASISGRILDEQGSPVVGVEVLVSGVDTARLDLARSRLIHDSKTGEDGLFAIDHLLAGEYVLFALSEQFEDYQRIGIELPPGGKTDLGTITLRHFPWAKLGVTVLNASGEALANMKVGLQQSPGQLEGRTDELGAFDFKRVAPGTWSLWISGEGQPDYTERIEIEAGAELQTEIRFPGGSHFIGGRMLIDGQPAPNFKVECGPRLSSELGPWLQWETKTDSEGMFRIDGLSAGRMDLAFNKDLPWTSYGTEAVETDRIDHVFDFETHSRLVTIHGQVRDELGAGLAGARIASFTPQNGKARGLSAADGSYSLEMELSYDSSFSLFAELEPYHTQRQPVRTARVDSANKLQVDFVLKRELDGGRITGTVRDSRGRGIPKVNVVCLSGPDESANAGWTDSDGRYRFKNVVPGKFSIHFRSKGYLPAVAESELAIGEEKQLDQVLGDQLRHTRRVRVLGADGGPIPSQEVEVWDDRSAFLVSGETDVHGEVELPGLPSGKLSFSVEARSYTRHELEYELDGESDQPIVLRLQRGSQGMSGSVVNAKGDPLIGMQVDLYGQGESGGIRAFAYTDAAGKFRFADLPGGSFLLECWTSDGTAKATAESGGPATRLVVK